MSKTNIYYFYYIAFFKKMGYYSTHFTKYKNNDYYS